MNRRSITIVSGGQTGADRAATDFAIENRISYGGWIPNGRLAEDGRIPARYSGYNEASAAAYSERTRLNVIDSDGTLIVSHGHLEGGSLLTFKLAKRLSKPCIYIDFDRQSLHSAASEARTWLRESRVAVLNVAGPRAGSDPLIYDRTKELLTLIFD